MNTGHMDMKRTPDALKATGKVTENKKIELPWPEKEEGANKDQTVSIDVDSTRQVHTAAIYK